jgi:hypothetical protein
MDDPVRMRRIERLGGLPEPLERAADRLRSLALDPVGERTAREVLHHDVGTTAVLADVEDRDRAGRMGEPRDRQRLAREAATNRVVVGKAAGEQLDGDDPRQVGVLGAVDLAHPAAGDPLGVPVALWKAALVHHDGLPEAAQPKTRPRPG